MRMYPAKNVAPFTIKTDGRLFWLVDSVGQIWSRKTTSRSYVEAVKRAYESNDQLRLKLRRGE